MTHSHIWTVVVKLGLLAYGLSLSVGCNPRQVAPGFALEGDGAVSDPSCPDPGSIVPDITCFSSRPDAVCAGSCAQTLDGIVGVGLSSCRCMDGGSGFGAQWICDTTACDAPTTGDAGMGTDTEPPVIDDAGVPDAPEEMCEPVTFEAPTVPGCTSEQRGEIMSIFTQADYDRFVANPANVDCNTCLSRSSLACATARGCDGAAGDLFCCLDAACGMDEACRNAAFEGACAGEVSALNRCVATIGFCGLNPEAPPPECFP